MRSSILLALGLAMASTQISLAQDDEIRGAGAYPMNTLDRIEVAGSRGRSRLGGDTSNTRIVTVDDDEDIGRAGAFPMNTMDRIKAAELNATRRSLSNSPARRAAVAATPGAQRTDSWRYVRFENRWWYYGADSQWQYWTGGHWNKFTAPATSAVQP